MSEELPFLIFDKTSKSFLKFNATWRSLLIKFRTPGEEQSPTTYLKECNRALTNCLVHDVTGKYMVGFRFCDTENVQDEVVDISLRRRDQFKPDVLWGVLGKSSKAMLGLDWLTVMKYIWPM